MKILVPEAHFASPEESFHLVTLMAMCAIRWPHRVLVEDDDSGHFKAWLETLGAELAETIRSALDEWALEEVDPALSGHPTRALRLRLRRRGPSSWTPPNGIPEVTIEDAIEVLARPFEIHLEDDMTDRDFLLAVARPEWRRRLERGEREGWILYFGGGASNMKRRFERIRRDTHDPRPSRSMPRRQRMWAMFDSDALAPGSMSPTARDLIRLCRRLLGEVGGFWCLKRRSIENYIPQALLDERSKREGHRATARVFARLNDAQRRHYNMKGGLKKDRGRHDRDRGENLWVNAPADLDGGFGDKVATVFADPRMSWARLDPDAREEADREIGLLVRRM